MVKKNGKATPSKNSKKVAVKAKKSVFEAWVPPNYKQATGGKLTKKITLPTNQKDHFAEDKKW